MQKRISITAGLLFGFALNGVALAQSKVAEVKPVSAPRAQDICVYPQLKADGSVTFRGQVGEPGKLACNQPNASRVRLAAGEDVNARNFFQATVDACSRMSSGLDRDSQLGDCMNVFITTAARAKRQSKAKAR